MSIVIDKILAATPNTERGRPTQLSADPKGERIAYAVSFPEPFPKGYESLGRFTNEFVTVRKIDFSAVYRRSVIK